MHVLHQLCQAEIIIIMYVVNSFNVYVHEEIPMELNYLFLKRKLDYYDKLMYVRLPVSRIGTDTAMVSVTESTVE